MSEPRRDVDVPPELRAGVWADDVEVFADVHYATLDFVRAEPRDASQGVVVARLTIPISCILKLRRELGGFE